MSHISKKELIDYALRDEFPLSVSKENLIREHLETCEDCRKQYMDLETRQLEVKQSLQPEAHFQDLKSRVDVRASVPKAWPMWLKAAAVVLILMSGYGGTVWWVNYRFDHGPMGLAAFEEDYRFAVSKESYRGENKEEPEDIRLFKEGVKTLFEAKRTTFGLFPRYDKGQLKNALSMIERSGSFRREDLRPRTQVFEDHIKKMLSENIN